MSLVVEVAVEPESMPVVLLLGSGGWLGLVVGVEGTKAVLDLPHVLGYSLVEGPLGFSDVAELAQVAGDPVDGILRFAAVVVGVLEIPPLRYHGSGLAAGRHAPVLATRSGFVAPRKLGVAGSGLREHRGGCANKPGP